MTNVENYSNIFTKELCLNSIISGSKPSLAPSNREFECVVKCENIGTANTSEIVLNPVLSTIDPTVTNGIDIKLGSDDGSHLIKVVNSTGINCLKLQSGGTGGISYGVGAAATNQQANAIAFGAYSGSVNQSEFAVAIGNGSGQNNQGEKSIALGDGSGQFNQGDNSVAVGQQASLTNQGNNCVCMGKSIASNQQNGSVCIGIGGNNEGSNSVTIGRDNGYGIGNDSVSIGFLTGSTNGGSNIVSIGVAAGRFFQSDNSICIGQGAGSADSLSTGSSQQGERAVSIGREANHVGNDGISLGYLTAVSITDVENQKDNAFYIGMDALTPNIRTTQADPLLPKVGDRLLALDTSNGEIKFISAMTNTKTAPQIAAGPYKNLLININTGEIGRLV